MNKLLILILWVLSSNQLFGQYSGVQWGTRILDYSSEYINKNNPNQYSAAQALGKPNKLPVVGGSPCAWSPSKQNAGEEYIFVGFKHPSSIRQVVVGESYNAGAIKSVILYDINDTPHSVYENPDPKASNKKGRMFHIIMKPTPYKVSSLKLILATDKVPGWNHIDAIGISVSEQPVIAKVNVAKNINHVEEIEPLGEKINSQYDEMLPVISADGNILYFDRKNHPENIFNEQQNDDIWYSIKDSSGWSEAVRMPAPLNNTSHNYVCSVTPDGNTLLLGNVYNSSGASLGGVSISNKTKTGWSFPKKLMIKNYHNDSKYSEFSLSNNRRVLLLAIKGKDSRGSKDIYVSFLNEDGSWSEPLNLGDKINTADSELTPFLASDGHTLYFASLGYSGYGNADMYVSRRLDNSWTNWSEPMNLGPTFNSSVWDASYTIDASGEYAYFVSYKNSLGRSADIFRAKLPQSVKPEPVALIQGTVYNSKTKKPIESEIIYEILSSGEEAGTALSEPFTGNYKITLPLNEAYAFWASAKGFLAIDESISLKNIKNYKIIKKDLYLTPIEVGQTIRLNNLFFVQSTDSLLIESFPELDRMVKALNDNPTVEIILEGHTDIGGSPIKNMELSKDRVKKIKGYLVNHGITSSRIGTKAFGSTKPITRLRDESSRKLNRRVEFRIVKE